MAKQKREIERLKRELQRSVRPTSPASADMSDHGMNGFNPRDTGSMSRSSNRMSLASTNYGEEKENGRGGALSPGLRSDSGRHSAAGMRQSSSGGDHDSWKRAAEVTSQLKLRIEVCFPSLPSAYPVSNAFEQQMKAKQGLSGRGTPQY